MSSPLIVSKNINLAAIISIEVNECWATFPSKPLRDLRRKEDDSKVKEEEIHKRVSELLFFMLLVEKIKATKNVKRGEKQNETKSTEEKITIYPVIPV